jgi:hypothetical protein
VTFWGGGVRIVFFYVITFIFLQLVTNDSEESTTFIFRVFAIYGAFNFALKLEDICSFETLVTTYDTT